MANNFDFKNFLFENKLGAYSRGSAEEKEQLKEEEHDAWSDYRRGAAPRPKGKDPKAMTFAQAKDAAMWKGLERDLGMFPYKVISDPKVTSADHYVNILNAVLKKKGKSLRPDQAEALKKYWITRNSSRKSTTEPTLPTGTQNESSNGLEMKEAILYSTIEKVEEVIDDRLMQTALDAIRDVLMDLEAKEDSEGDKITHEEALAYLQMKMKEYLGDWK